MMSLNHFFLFQPPARLEADDDITGLSKPNQEWGENTCSMIIFNPIPPL